MAKYEDYVKNLNPEGDELTEEITEAGEQTEELKSSTPEVNWEDRYKELEKHNSRQAQELGNYRKMIDEYITAPTPDNATESNEPPQVDVDKLYDNPTEVFDEQISKHPAVRKVEELEKKLREREIADAESVFLTQHPDFETIANTPEFANWVAENPTRGHLAQAAHRYDFSAADALFSLYKAEKGLTQAAAEAQQEEVVSLEEATASEPPAPASYSRSEMVRMKTRAKQGDNEAEEYVRAHSAAYLQALSEGNVRP